MGEITKLIKIYKGQEGYEHNDRLYDKKMSRTKIDYIFRCINE